MECTVIIEGGKSFDEVNDIMLQKGIYTGQNVDQLLKTSKYIFESKKQAQKSLEILEFELLKKPGKTITTENYLFRYDTKVYIHE
ncbi:MAG: hypothetical protein ACOC22_01950 [bacterium]